jgi:hypothetical protein
VQQLVAVLRFVLGATENGGQGRQRRPLSHNPAGLHGTKLP